MSQLLLRELAAARREAEALMLDTCRADRVARVDDDDDIGDATVVYVDPPVYEGRCKVQTYEPHERVVNIGGASRVLQRYRLDVPWNAGPFRVGDLITITAALSASAVHASESRYRVAGLHEKTLQSAQRLLVEEEVG